MGQKLPRTSEKWNILKTDSENFRSIRFGWWFCNDTLLMGEKKTIRNKGQMCLSRKEQEESDELIHFHWIERKSPHKTGSNDLKIFWQAGNRQILYRRKYFFFDIDGTLTEKVSRVVVPSALEAIRKLKEAGHFVSICTGRAYYKSEPFRVQNGFDHMVCNGGHGIVIDGRLVENAPLPYDRAKAVYDQARELGYGVLVQGDESEKVYTEDFRFYDQVGPRREPTIYIIDEHYDPQNTGVIYKMYVSISKEEEDRLTLKDSLGHLRFMPEYLMFQPDEKDKGILRMLELQGGNPEDVVVFGDDDNDLIMFVEPFTRVAMGNACAALKERADLIAKSNVEDGIYDLCQEQGWFEPVTED